MARVNELGQRVGQPVPGWTPRRTPTTSVLTGQYCRLERLDPDRHAQELSTADRRDARGESWTYLPYGPFTDLASYREWVKQASNADDPFFYAVIDTDSTTGKTAPEHAVGVLSYLRVQAEVGSIEVGHVHYSPLLQRRRAATAWYSITDMEWPAIQDRLRTWLAADNFDDHGHQRTQLPVRGCGPRTEGSCRVRAHAVPSERRGRVCA